MVMSDIKLLEKSGGKSGEWKAGEWGLNNSYVLWR
jgi:hypothetical protein